LLFGWHPLLYGGGVGELLSWPEFFGGFHHPFPLFAPCYALLPSKTICMYICMYVHMYICTYVHMYIFFKEVARGGERTRVLLISFIFSFFTTLLLSHSGSPSVKIYPKRIRPKRSFAKSIPGWQRSGRRWRRWRRPRPPIPSRGCCGSASRAHADCWSAGCSCRTHTYGANVMIL
jgi:hypothetical protein